MSRINRLTMMLCDQMLIVLTRVLERLQLTMTIFELRRSMTGVKQSAIGCNKMDCDTAGYSSVATICPSATSDFLSYVGLRDPL